MQKELQIISRPQTNPYLTCNYRHRMLLTLNTRATVFPQRKVTEQEKNVSFIFSFTYLECNRKIEKWENP